MGIALPFLILFGLVAAGSGNRRKPAPTNNGLGVSRVPTGSAVRRTVPAAQAAKPRTAAPAKPAAKPPLTITRAPGSATPATAQERASVEKAVSEAVRLFQAGKPSGEQSTVTPPSPPSAATQQQRLAKDAAQDLAAFLRATGRFGSSSDRVPEVQAAQRDLRVAADGIVGPVTRAAAQRAGVKLPAKPAPTKATRAAAISSPLTPSSTPRTPRAAAEDLREFLTQTRRFGSRADRPVEVKLAQRDLRLTPDGIVGPKTRAAAARTGVTLPNP